MSGVFAESPNPSPVGGEGVGFEVLVRPQAADAAVLVAVSGEVDLATAPELARALESAGVGGAPLVVLFIDAHGLGVVVAARESLLKRSADLLIRDPSAMLRRMLGITGLAGLLEQS
jgi:anti-sigma B factor antagonist